MPQKVLIVEDHADISGSLKLLIEMRGYEARVANDGFEGVQMALDEKPDLILMDLALPGLDGFDTTREIRSQPENNETPIVCVSSHTEGLEERILAAGCSEFLSKTSFITSLDVTLKKYLED